MSTVTMVRSQDNTFQFIKYFRFPHARRVAQTAERFYKPIRQSAVEKPTTLIGLCNCV